MKHILFYNLILGKLGRSPVAKRYTAYVAAMGAVMSVLQFGEVIARKSLDASGLAVTLLVMTMPIGALTSIWWARIIEGRDQRKLLVTVGAVGYLSLATGAMLFHIEHMIAVHLIFFLSFALLGPAENRVLQQHVSSTHTGRTFGFASSMRMGIAALVSAGAGVWMDMNDGAFRNIYPIMAFIGFSALGLIATIKLKPMKEARPVNARNIIVEPLREAVILLKRRKDYLRYEGAFMLYGIAFMMTLPVVPMYLVDDLQLNYSTIGLARGMISQLVMIAAIPFFGRVFDKSTPHRIGMSTFAALSLYPLLVWSAGLVDGTLRQVMIFIAFGWFGTVMSSVMVLWQLSSIRFAGSEDAGIYHSVHVAATGVRGMFAPLLGLAMMSLFDKQTALVVCSGVFLCAGAAMWGASRLDIRPTQAVSTYVSQPK